MSDLSPEECRLLEQAQHHLDILREAEASRRQTRTPTEPTSTSFRAHGSAPRGQVGSRLGSPGPLAADLAAFVDQVKLRREARRREERAAEERERLAFTGSCWSCRDTGWTQQGVLDTPCQECARGRAIEQQRHLHRVADLWAQAQLPPRQGGYRLDTYPAQHLAAFAGVRAWLAQWDGASGLLLVGPFSVGKTGLAVGVMYEIAHAYAASHQHFGVRYAATVEFLDAMRPTNHDDETRDRVMWTLQRVRCLLLDDLGKDKPSEWVHDRLYDLVNYRYNHELPTLVTTNYGAEQLVDRAGKGVVDRLVQMCDWIRMDEGAPNLRTGRTRK